jgi:hypothetical protein
MILARQESVKTNFICKAPMKHYTGIEKKEMHNEDEENLQGIECLWSVTRRKVENNK